MKHRSTKASFFLASLSIATLSTLSFGQNIFDGSTDDAWEDPTNWNTGLVPLPGETAYIVDSANIPVFSSASGTQTLGQQQVGFNGFGLSTFNITGGELNAQLHIAQGGNAQGIVNLSGGTVNMGAALHYIGQNDGTGVGGEMNVSGTATWNWDGGALWMADAVAAGKASVDLSGTSVTSGGIMGMDRLGNADFTVRDNASATFLQLDFGGGSSATLTLSDTATLRVGTLNMSDGAGTETLNFNGGTLSVGTANVDLEGTTEFVVGTGATLLLGDNSHVFTDDLRVATGGTLGTGNNSATAATIQTGMLTLDSGANIDFSINGETSVSDTWSPDAGLTLSDSATYNLIVDVVAGDVKQTAGPWTLFDTTTGGIAGMTDFNTITWNITAADGTRLSSTGDVVLNGSLIQLDGFEAFSIPEPSTAMLLGMGAVVMILRRRMRR